MEENVKLEKNVYFYEVADLVSSMEAEYRDLLMNINYENIHDGENNEDLDALDEILGFIYKLDNPENYRDEIIRISIKNGRRDIAQYLRYVEVGNNEWMEIIDDRDGKKISINLINVIDVKLGKSIKEKGFIKIKMIDGDQFNFYIRDDKKRNMIHGKLISWINCKNK